MNYIFVVHKKNTKWLLWYYDDKNDYKNYNI